MSNKITVELDLESGRTEMYVPGHGHYAGRSAQAVRFNSAWARMEDIWEGDEEAQQTGRWLRTAIVSLWGDDVAMAIGALMAADFTVVEGER